MSQEIGIVLRESLLLPGICKGCIPTHCEGAVEDGWHILFHYEKVCNRWWLQQACQLIILNHVAQPFQYDQISKFDLNSTKDHVLLPNSNSQTCKNQLLQKKQRVFSSTNRPYFCIGYNYDHTKKHITQQLLLPEACELAEMKNPNYMLCSKCQLFSVARTDAGKHTAKHKVEKVTSLF